MVDSGRSKPQRPPRYRLYIDESGDHTYNQIDQVSHRYLALLGVWFKQPEHYVAFSDGLEALTRCFFGPRPDTPVVLHRSDIINRKGAFGVLYDQKIRSEFDEALLSLIQDSTFMLVCVVIDKKSHLNRYNSPFHPYHLCLAALLDRFSGYLNYRNAVGDVMAESRGREEDLQLKQAYRTVYESGTLLFDRHHHQRALTSAELKIKPKTANIAGIQLADILAHPVKQHCLAHQEWIPEVGNNFGNQIVTRILPKFNRRYDKNRIDGYGRVYL